MTINQFTFDEVYSLWESPSILSQLPFTFPNGFKWTVFNGYCGECNCPIHSNQLRGRVSNPFPNILTFKAVGFCQDCDLFTSYLYHAHDDMRLTDTNCNVWTPAKSWLEKVKHSIFQYYKS